MIDQPDRQPRRRFTFTVEDAGGSDVPVIIRIRGFLKSCLRAWRLRCVRAVEELPADEQRDEAIGPAE